VALAENGVLKKYKVRMLGANLRSIKKAEERDLFKKTIQDIGLEVPKSGYAHSWEEAKKIVKEIGFPAIIRPSYTLGGSGGNVAYNTEEYAEYIRWGLALSPKSQVLVEESVAGWKEYELEVMRDRKDNVVIVCSIENLDPMGIHTGDSITVAQSRQRQALRHRDEPAGLAQLGAGLEGDRFRHRQDRVAAGGRIYPGRDSQRHHEEDARLFRADD